MKLAPNAPHIVIAGAGSIGCFVGGLLAAAGHPVTLLGRTRVLDTVAAQGLRLTDYAGLNLHVPADRLGLADTPDGLRDADLVLVTVKSDDTGEIAETIAGHAPPFAPVVSLQNGLEAAEILYRALPGRDLRAGMVPFNVVPKGPGAWHRATSGDIVIGAGRGGLAARLSVPHLPVTETPEIRAIQWGKLVLNLNNALNALSGLPLKDQLLDNNWRRLMADQMAEALAVLKAAGIALKSTTPLPAWAGPHVLRLPTPIFIRVAAQMLTIDPLARTSMAWDLENGRKTEIASLQGAIAVLGRENGLPTPICDRISDEIARVGATGPVRPKLSPVDLRG